MVTMIFDGTVPYLVGCVVGSNINPRCRSQQEHELQDRRKVNQVGVTNTMMCRP